MQESTVRQRIFEHLQEVEQLLEEATCNGEQLAELGCFTEVETALNTLSATVDYYID
jgi:hypothetical protein